MSSVKLQNIKLIYKIRYFYTRIKYMKKKPYTTHNSIKNKIPKNKFNYRSERRVQWNLQDCCWKKLETQKSTATPRQSIDLIMETWAKKIWLYIQWGKN